MKKLVNKFYGVTVTAMLAMAAFLVTPACVAWHYQPKVPESLRK